MSRLSGWKVVPVEIDRETCRPMLDVWNRAMENCETLEMVWPKLVEAAPSLLTADKERRAR